MKKRIEAIIHRRGSSNDAILAAVASFNQGLVKYLTLLDFIGYIKVLRAAYPALHEKLSHLWDSQNATLHITEDNGETYTISLRMIELSELVVKDLGEAPTLTRQEFS